MVQLTTRERVDAFWARTLCLDVADLHTTGVHARENPSGRDAWGGVYVLALDESAWVFAPTDLIAAVTEAIAEHDIASVLEPDTWHDVLGERVRVAFGPVVHHYRDHLDGLREMARGRRVNPRDAASLAELRAAVPPDEWLSAGFTAQPAMLFGVFEDDRMIAAANLTSGPDAATDVGIVIHPDARGRGLAVQIAAAAAHQALLMHGVARFRALATSKPTLAVASKLGFEEYGRNLSVFLR